jgi:hypothetical protein
MHDLPKLISLSHEFSPASKAKQSSFNRESSEKGFASSSIAVINFQSSLEFPPPR